LVRSIRASGGEASAASAALPAASGGAATPRKGTRRHLAPAASSSRTQMSGTPPPAATPPQMTTWPETTAAWALAMSGGGGPEGRSWDQVVAARSYCHTSPSSEAASPAPPVPVTGAEALEPPYRMSMPALLAGAAQSASSTWTSTALQGKRWRWV
jgi:hypothetical protein